MVGNGLIEKEDFSTYQDDDFWFVQINQIRELKNSFFTVATRENSLSTILEQAPNEIVIAPEHFSSQKKYIGIKAADTEYLEGSIDTVAKEPTFRFDFVLITVLDILQRAAAYLNTKITVSTIGFNFEINKSDREPRDKQYLQVLLKNQKSIFEAILSNPSIFPNLVLNQGSYRKDDVDYKKDSKNRFVKHKISDMNKLNNINNAKLKSFFHLGLFEQVHEVCSISTFEQWVGKFDQLVSIDKSFSPGYFFNTGHFDSLSLLDYLDEL